MPDPRILQLADGRSLAFDDVGDPGGVPVVYLHGTPDSRLARHPDDRVTVSAGVRLLAVDRPGAGASDLPPADRSWRLADDVAALLDDLGIARTGLLGWSSGGLAALRVASALGGRITALATVGTLPPVEAYEDEDLIAALGRRRRPFVELAMELLDEGVAPEDIAAEVAAHLVPDPLDAWAAHDHVVETAGEQGLGHLERVPGAVEQLTAAIVEAVRLGHAGLVPLVADQLLPGPELGAVQASVVLWHGSDDDVAPPTVGTWLASRLPSARVEVVPGGHELLLTRWADVLASVVAPDVAGARVVGEDRSSVLADHELPHPGAMEPDGRC